MDKSNSSLADMTVSSTQYSSLRTPDSATVETTIATLIEFYGQFDFYKSKRIEYICALASRYAGWTLPRQCPLDALLSYALWLSMIWLVDGIFDEGEIIDPTQIINIFDRDPPDDSDPVYILESPREDSNPAIDLIHNAYQWYLELIVPYQRAHSIAYARVHYWLLQYLRVQLNPTPKSFDEYQGHRLADGGMMCVIWQLIMYTRTECLDEYDAFYSVAWIVSYHNDLLSVERDIKCGTPNLLNYFAQLSIWDRYTKAIELINHLYSDGDWEILPKNLHKICWYVLCGSHNWCITEPRYQDGIKILSDWEGSHTL